MCAFLLQVPWRAGGTRGSSCSTDDIVLGPGTKSAACSSGTTETVTGIVRWSDCGVCPKDLHARLEKGEIVDGSYLLVCVFPNKIRIWSDPLGTIPGYYGLNGSFFVVGTNVLDVANLVDNTIDEKACRLFALFDYVPQPHTIFLHISRCAPGTVIDIDVLTGQTNIRQYFDLQEAAISKAAELKKGSQHADSLIHEAWLSSLSKVMSSVDPSAHVGISLSGGLDSRYLMCAAKELGYNCFCYTFSSSSHASDAVLARQCAERAGFPWKMIPFEYTVQEMASFIAKYGSMEPPTMSFLPRIVQCAKNNVEVVLAAQGGDVTWGSHTSLKQSARVLSAYTAWRKRCASRGGAWVAASEIGDISWARPLPAWDAITSEAAAVFDDATRRWHRGLVFAERLWSICYRQPSYTWNSNLVYDDLGMAVLCPTITLESVLTGLALPIADLWAGNAYARSLARFYPDVASIPLTRTRISPRRGLICSELAGLSLPLRRLARLDWYVSWVRQSDWLPIWDQALRELVGVNLAEITDEQIPISVKVRLSIIRYLLGALSKKADITL